MSLTLDQLRARAEAWQDALGQGSIVKSESTVGGGSLPEESMPTYVLSLDIKSPEKFLKKLRECTPPIISRTESDKVLLDPRTVFPEQDQFLISSLKSLISENK